MRGLVDGPDVVPDCAPDSAADMDTTGGVLRALLSDSYRPIEDLDVLLATLAGIRASGRSVEIRSCDLTENRMYVTVACPEVAAMAPALLGNYRSPYSGNRDADNPLVFAGFVFQNSETGSGRYRLTPRIEVQICTNGVTITRDAVSEVHLGGKLDAGPVRWSADTTRRATELITAKTRDAVGGFLDQGYLERQLAEITAQAGAPVTDATGTIEQVSAELHYTKAQADAILEDFLAGGDRSAGGVLHAVTSAAQREHNAETAHAMEADGIPSDGPGRPSAARLTPGDPATGGAGEEKTRVRRAVAAPGWGGASLTDPGRASRRTVQARSARVTRPDDWRGSAAVGNRPGHAARTSRSRRRSAPLGARTRPGSLPPHRAPPGAASATAAQPCARGDGRSPGPRRRPEITVSSRPDSRPNPTHPVWVPHPARPRTAAPPLACAARAAATVAGLRIDPDGHLVEVAVPLRATAWALAGFTDTEGPADLEALTLDRDLLCWTGDPARGRHNPVASVAAAMFGRPGPIHGPVVFTGQVPTDPGSPTDPGRPGGQVDHVGVAAVILLAGAAASCDLSDRTAERAAEFARLGIHVEAPPPSEPHLLPAAAGEVYDSQRHTVARDGGWPRCGAAVSPPCWATTSTTPTSPPTDPPPPARARPGADPRGRAHRSTWPRPRAPCVRGPGPSHIHPNPPREQLCHGHPRPQLA